MLDSRFQVRKLEPSHIDQRGEIYNLHVFLNGYSWIEYYTSMEGVVRGNHYHPEGVEVVFLFDGLFEIFVKDLDSSDGIERRVIEPGQLVTCGPRVVHAHRFLKDSRAIAFSDIRKEKER